MALWSVWLYGILFIAFSMYATQRLPFFLNESQTPSFITLSDTGNPRIIIFSAPVPFAGSVGARQALAIRSWLALSPQVAVLLFTQDPSAVSFASAFDSRVLVDSSIDFT